MIEVKKNPLELRDMASMLIAVLLAGFVLVPLGKVSKHLPADVVLGIIVLLLGVMSWRLIRDRFWSDAALTTVAGLVFAGMIVVNHIYF